MTPSRADRVPVAKVFREAGKPARPIPIPFATRARGILGPVGTGARTAVNAALGMWPLTAVILMMVALLIVAGNATGP